MFGEERGGVRAQYFAQRFFACVFGNGRVQAGNGIAQASHQYHVGELIPFCRRFAGRHVRTVTDRIAEFPEPGQGGLFDV